MPPELATALKRWKLECPPNELDLLFPAPGGKPAHRSNILRSGLYPALQRAGLRQVDMHSLRHGFASALINGGATVTEVQALMGHADPTVTLKIYAHWFQSTRTDAVGTLAKTLCGKGQTPAKRSGT